MKQFILAFPLPISEKEPFKITENVQVLADTKSLMIPGCTVQFDVVRQGASANLLEIFKDRCELTEENERILSSHKSLLFLLGCVKNMDDVNMVNAAIMKMFAAEAMGVYMQESGMTWMADDFKDELGDGEYPMDPWIDILDSGESLYTLGLAVFALPDLCISKSIDDPEEALLMAADSLFGKGIPAKSGSVIDWGDDEKYVLRQESKSLFSKNAPEYNRQGILRIVKK